MRIEAESMEGAKGAFDDNKADIYKVTEAFVNLLMLEGYAPVSIYRGLDNALYHLKERFEGIPFKED